MNVRHWISTCLLSYIAVSALGCSKKTETISSINSGIQPSNTFFQVDAATAGSATGVIRFTGRKPSRKRINMSEDPACVIAHGGMAHDESLVVNATGALANAFVYIEKGLEGKAFEPSNVPIVIDQRGCWFHPRVLGVQTGQVLRVINSDPVTHNIHPMAQVNREWNHSQGPEDGPLSRKFLKSEVMIPIKCNIHSWMHAFVGVLPHPYFSVSKEDGSFEIRNLPPGTYTIAVWQERLGVQHHEITISPHANTVIDFIYEGK